MIPLLLLALPFPAPAQSAELPARTAMHLLDVDGDGALDVLTLEDGVLRLRLQRAGSFTDAGRRWGLSELGTLTGVAPADADGDGDPDLLLLGPGAPRLLENLGSSFGPATVLEHAPGAVDAARWIDVDADGRPDLHLGGAAAGVVLRNLGELRFEPFEGLPALGVPPAPAQPDRAPGGDEGSAAASAPGSVSAASAGARTAAAALGLCAATITDSVLGGCIPASAVPALGSLLPLSVDFNVDLAGNVGVGTTTPTEKLTVVGAVESTAGGFRFPDGTLQASAASDDWNALENVPPGFADGVDNDTTYAASTGLTLAAGFFGFDTGFGDARYWNEGQALGGDLDKTLGNAVVLRLRTRPLAVAAPQTGEVLKWDGAEWAPSPDADTDTTYSAVYPVWLNGTALSIVNNGIASAKLASDEDSLAKVSDGALIANGGYLGIGTSAPDSALEVVAGSTTALKARYAGLGSEAAVRGDTISPDGHGVYGTNKGAAGTGAGVQGDSTASTNPGVLGVNSAASGTGVRAVAYGLHGYGLQGVATGGARYGSYASNLTSGSESGGTAVYASYASSSGVGSSGVTPSRGVFAHATSTRARGVSGQVFGSPSTKSSDHVGVYGTTVSSNSYGMYSDGDFGASGVKSFLQPHPTDPSRAIRFICLEGDEAGTYFRGSGVLVGGVAEIEIPEAWTLASEAEDITVQVTAVGTPARLWVAEKSRERIVVRGDLDTAFDFTVNGVRRGFAGHEAIEPNGYFRPTVRDMPYGTQFPEALREILVQNGTLNPDYTPNEATAASQGWELYDADDPRSELPQAMALDSKSPVEEH